MRGRGEEERRGGEEGRRGVEERRRGEGEERERGGVCSYCAAMGSTDYKETCETGFFFVS